jgi:hypothetical protein
LSPTWRNLGARDGCGIPLSPSQRRMRLVEITASQGRSFRKLNRSRTSPALGFGSQQSRPCFLAEFHHPWQPRPARVVEPMTSATPLPASLPHLDLAVNELDRASSSSSTIPNSRSQPTWQSRRLLPLRRRRDGVPPPPHRPVWPHRSRLGSTLGRRCRRQDEPAVG